MTDRDPLDRLPYSVADLLRHARRDPQASAVLLVIDGEPSWTWNATSEKARQALARAVLDLADAIVTPSPEPDPSLAAFLQPLERKPWLPAPSDKPWLYQRPYHATMAAIDERELLWLRRAVTELQAEIVKRDRTARRDAGPGQRAFDWIKAALRAVRHAKP